MSAESPLTELDTASEHDDGVPETSLVAQAPAAASPAQGGDEQEEDCSICAEPVGQDDEAMHCDGSAGLRHRFHGHCLTRWVESCRSRATRPTCPNCRGPVEIHSERLASQIGASGADIDSVQEFLAIHRGESASEGWVRVREQPLPIVEALKRQFEALDLTLASQRQPAGSMGSSSSSQSAALAEEPENQLVNIAAMSSTETTMALVEVAPMDSLQAGTGSQGPLATHPLLQSVWPIAATSPSAGEGSQGPPATPPLSVWPSRFPCELNDSAMRQIFTVGEVQVHFPFEEVLQPQQYVIRSTVEAALQGRHVLIESPTGTGKTMALLCASLAAQRHLAVTQGTAPSIIF
eukprot:TRINITY_DN20915_c0_g1_i1.p1 TRINITY_DN20915_c0_g1~~TRINITY_DN20915_c0_g1_i1.p1  ORF type:complete len:350 (+),score=61.06 TRINITY_DN20915_c0_g1_i1:224-1273(+)